MPRCAPTPDLNVVAGDRAGDRTEIGCSAGSLLDQPAETVRKGDAAGLDPDERHPHQIWIRLDDLVRDPRQRPPQCVGIEEDGSRRSLHRTHRAGRVDGLRAGSFMRLLPGLTGPA